MALSDIDGHKFETPIRYLQQQGVVEGYPDGTFRPYQILNRAELLKILVESKYGDSAINKFSNYDICFTDLESGQWYVKYVCFGKNYDIVDGYPDGTFRPGDSVNFVEAVKMVIGTYGIAYTENVVPWYSNILLEAENESIIPTNNESAGDNVTRGSMAEMMTRAMLRDRGDLMDYLDGTLDILTGRAAQEDITITYNNPSGANYTSMPTSITFDWSVSVKDADLVLEYHNYGQTDGVKKTVRFSNVDGRNHTLSKSAYEVDLKNYGTFCWKLEKDNTYFDSTTNGYPCKSYKPGGFGAVEYVEMSYMNTDVYSVFDTMPSSITFSWPENLSNAKLLLEYREGQDVGKTVSFDANGTSATLNSASFSTDLEQYGSFCWKLQKGETIYIEDTHGYPCLTYTPADTSGDHYNISLVAPAHDIEYETIPESLTFKWSADFGPSTILLRYPRLSGTDIKMQFSQASGNSRTLSKDLYENYWGHDMRELCWTVFPEGGNVTVDIIGRTENCLIYPITLSNLQPTQGSNLGSSVPAQIDFSWDGYIEDPALIKIAIDGKDTRTFGNVTGESSTISTATFASDLAEVGQFCWTIETSGPQINIEYPSYPCVYVQ